MISLRTQVALAALCAASMAVSGCSSSSSQSATPVFSVTPASLAFGSVTVNTTSSALTATISNTGNGTLNASSITVNGSTNFTLASNTCGSSLAAGASCTVGVTFTPTAVTSYSATVSIADNASGSPHTVALTGTGTAVPTPSVSFSPASLSFPNTTSGVTSAALSTTLTNTGTGTLNLSSVSITGTSPSAFTISSNTCGSTLAASATCTVGVTFTPPGTLLYGATLSFADNATGSPQTVNLSGSGLASTLTFSSGSFGSDLVGSIGINSIIVTNPSTTTAATFSASPTISGTNASTFAVAGNNCTTTLAAGATCNILVNFSPTAVTSYSATLNIPNSLATGAQPVALTGTGAVEPSSCKSTSTTSPSQTAPTPNTSGNAFSGKVLAGTTPVIGATVQIYAAGQTGNGLAPKALLSTALTTDSNGAFSVPSGFTCPYSNSVLYAVARGGKAGATGATNAGIVLSTVLGTCSSITGNPTYVLNEATTATMAWSMSQFLALGGNMGATATNSAGTTNSSGIVLAAGTFANLINPLSGSAPGTYFPSTGTAPKAKINSLANALNACTTSSGATSASCTQLYTLSTTSAGAPTNTLDAAMNIAQHASANTAALYTLSTASTAFSPSLTTAPADWTLFVNYSGGGMDGPGSLSIDSTGRVWVVSYFSTSNSGSASTTLFANTGTPVFPSGISANNLLDSYGGASDINDVMWVANEESPYGINTALGSITQLTNTGTAPANFGNGGLNFPISISFDTSGQAWVANYGNSTLTLFNATGTPLSGTKGYASAQYVFPVAIASDAKCNSYMANESSNTVTFTSADGTISGSYVVGSAPDGLAVDGSGNLWTANFYADSVGLLSSAGKVTSGASGFTGGGIDHPQGIAVDGANNVWVASYRSAAGVNPALTELAAASATTPGAVIGPSTGWGLDAAMLEPFAVAIDASGNVWVTNFGSNVLTEFVGMAAPVKTPLVGPVRVP